jgi:peptidoglycan/LPS O-acetylase OafA/YrhL
MGKAPPAFDRGTSRDDVDRSTFLSRMIDVARGLAILLVLLVHLEQDFSYYVFAPVSHRIVALLGMFEFGAAGVGLFFVISGYLLNLLYADDFNVRKYWVRRFARIYPAWLFWSLVAIVAAVVHAGPAYMGEPFYGQAVRLDSWPHIGIVVLQLLFLGFLVPATWNVFIPGGWSIQAEMFNYALYTFIRRLRFSAVLIGVLTLEILQAVLFPILGFSSSNIGVAQIVQSYMTAPVWFVAGMFLCRVASSRHQRELLLESSLLSLVLGFAVIAGLNAAFVSQATTLGVVLAAIAVSYLAVRLGRWKALAKIGKYSYGIYFCHFLLLLPASWLCRAIVKALGPDLSKVSAAPLFIVTYLAVLSIAFVIARVVFELIERRPIEWARKRPKLVRRDH